MDIEKRIEVAEKVWKWDLQEKELDFWERRLDTQIDMFIPESHPDYINIDEYYASDGNTVSQYFLDTHRNEFYDFIIRSLDSWSAFGRSWNFFREKFSHCITIDFCWHEDAKSWACNVGIDTNYSFSGYGNTQIEAIHNAALEALKDEQLKAK